MGLYADGAPRSTEYIEVFGYSWKQEHMSDPHGSVNRPKEHLLKKVKAWTIGPLV